MANFGNSRTANLAPTALCAAALAIVASIWIFVFLQIRHERSAAAAAAVRENEQRAVAFEQYVSRTIEAADLASAYVANRYAHLLESSGRPAGIARIDDSFLRPKGVLETNLLNAQGYVVATNGDTPVVNAFASDIFQGDLHSPDTRLRIGPPKQSRISTDWFIIMSRRLNHPDGSFAGSLGVHLPPGELTRFARSAPIGADDTLSVVGLDGIVRARLVGRTESFGQNLANTPAMAMQRQRPNGTYVGPGVIDGKVRFFSQRRLPHYGLFVASGISEAAVLAPVRARARGYVLAAGAITFTTLAAACLLHLLLRRRIRREQEVTAANIRLKEAQRLAKLGDWSFDPLSGELLLSDELCATYNCALSPRMDLGAFGALVGQDGLETFRLMLEQVLATGERQEGEIAAQLPGGSVSHRQIVAVPTFDETGALIGIHGTDQDVTAGKLLDSLREQVRHLSRMDAMNALTSTIAHELNQPLTAASNYLSVGIWMASNEKQPKKGTLVDSLRSADSQIHHAADIVRRVRHLVRARESIVEPISLSEVVGQAVALVEAANPGVAPSLSHRLDPEGDIVLADSVQLQQVLVNLIRNAREACRAGNLRIAIESAVVNDECIEVSIVDNGPGIPRGNTDIFAPFISSKGEGMGLGLAICRTLIEAMHGRIWVKETGNAGTRISFTLPRAPVPANEDRVEETARA